MKLLEDKHLMEKLETFQKQSRRAAFISLIGVVFLTASLLYASYKLNSDIGEKRDKLTNMNAEIAENESKLKERKDEIEKLESAVAALSNQLPAANLNKAAQLNPDVNAALKQVKALEPSNTNVTPNPKSAANPKDAATASAEEKKAFQALTEGRYDEAIKAFDAAERAYNGYNNVWEISRLLKVNKAEMNNPVKKREVFETIEKKYSWRAPADSLQKIKSAKF